MPEIVNCPKCDRKLRVPDDLIGQAVKCPTCSETFTATIAAPEPPPSVPAPPPPFPLPDRSEPELLQRRYEEEAGGAEAPPPFPREGNYRDGPRRGDYDDESERYRQRMALHGPAMNAVSGPATGLLVTGILGIISTVLWALVQMGQIAEMGGRGRRRGGMAGGGGDEAVMGFVLCFGVLFAIAMCVLVIMGAQKMKRLESYGFAMTGSILAMIPCTSPCCLLGLPFGIWAVVVLNSPEVRDAFRS
jgi:predicted Zn finger-like uncharacterized protein